MTYIVVFGSIVIALSGIALWLAAKEDKQLANIRRRLKELEDKEKGN